MEEKEFPPRKDVIATYKKYLLLKICADTDMEMLVAESNSPRMSDKKAAEINQIEIKKQQVYMAKLDEIIHKFEMDLYCFAKSYGATEYEVFGLLFIKKLTPQQVADKVHVALQYVYNLQSKFKKDLKSLSFRTIR